MSDRPSFEFTEQVLLAKCPDGSFVMAETFDEVSAMILEKFPDFKGGVECDTGRVERSPDGGWDAVFKDDNGKVRFRMRFA